jgi:hypothetical protein
MKQLLEIHPSPGRVSMTSTNLKDATKQVIVTIDGVRYTLSPKLTEDFRNKRITIEELGEYFVRDVEGKDGTTFFSLGYPSEDINVQVTAWKSRKLLERKDVTVEQLMELVAL